MFPRLQLDYILMSIALLCCTLSNKEIRKCGINVLGEDFQAKTMLVYLPFLE